MERLKGLCKKVFFLPPLLTVIIAVPSFVLVCFVLANGVDGAAAYLSYGASAYALIISVAAIPRLIRFSRSFRERIAGHPVMDRISGSPFGARYLNDVRFRTEVSLYRGFFINLLYIVIKMVSGIYYRSVWFIALAVYYILLAVMRFLLFHRGGKNPEGNCTAGEWRRCRLCGVVLLLMNQALAGIVIFMVHQNRGYTYPGMLIYAMAAYSFYAVIIAAVNLIRFRKHKSPVLSAAKAINLVSAMVSILSLETAMLVQFDNGNDPAFRRLMTGATGGGICTVVLAMAIFMIVKSTREISNL